MSVELHEEATWSTPLAGRAATAIGTSVGAPTVRRGGSGIVEDRLGGPTARWLSTAVRRLGHESLRNLGLDAGTIGSWTGPSRAGYPALGPAAFLAWSGRDRDDDTNVEISARITDAFLEVSPVLRGSRVLSRLAPRMPARIRPAWTVGAAISTGATLGWVILGLEGRVPEAQRRRWMGALARCFEDLQRMTRLRYYVNGNYQVPLCELAYHHARLSGSDAADEEYEGCVDFLCHPEATGPRWRGHGLRLETPPRRRDWHDAVGYFSEYEGLRGGGRPCFDGEYIQLQLDYVIRLWLLTREDRFLRLSNALINALLPLTDRVTWQADCRGGSRRDQIIPFWNASLVTLALHDDRADFTDQDLHSQFTIAIEAEYRRRAASSSVDDYVLRGYGLTLLSIMLASTAPQG
jgi:hypothetical protein